jgi:hypothetical protein
MPLSKPSLCMGTGQSDARPYSEGILLLFVNFNTNTELSHINRADCFFHQSIANVQCRCFLSASSLSHSSRVYWQRKSLLDVKLTDSETLTIRILLDTSKRAEAARFVQASMKNISLMHPSPRYQQRSIYEILLFFLYFPRLILCI